MRVGDLDVAGLSDGTFTATAEFFGPGADFSGHEDLLDADGAMRLPIGAFLVRGGNQTVLVDAGLGPVRDGPFEGGRLLEELAATGTDVEDVDLVICSHLHFDHCGWLVGRHDRRLVFPRANVAVGAPDWRLFVDGGVGDMGDHVREGLRSLAESGRVSRLDGDATLAEGVTVLAAPGHTPGSTVVVVSSRGERALLLGDAVVCPVQLQETEWAAMSDVDPALARRTRERLWRELEAEATVGAGAHFPGLAFGRVLRGQGRRWLL